MAGHLIERTRSVSEKSLQPAALVPLQGGEAIRGTDATVLDFWRFALPDLRMNNARGYLGEFLVARAVGATAARTEWDAFDVLAPDGTRIEVKTSAHLQAWEQARLSAIRFSGLRSRGWAPGAGYDADKTYHADVYVFCVITALEHDRYDPLDVNLWQFYVLLRGALALLGVSTLSLGKLAQLTGVTSYSGLASAIAAAADPESS